MSKKEKNNSYRTTNPSLEIIKPGWGENPLGEDGKYINLDGPSERSFQELLKWQLGEHPYRRIKKNQVSNVGVVNNELFLHTYREGITWLGHASFFLQLEGYRIIIDPVFYDLGPLKRYTDMPCNPEHIKALDYILISHNHRDHLDESSIKLLCKYNPEAVILTGLQIGPLLRKWKITNTIIEAGWYQQYFSNDFLTITYLPAKHWNRRYLLDLNTMLWGSFMIETHEYTLYFGADSGLGIHFAEIAGLYPDIDYAFLGIGAYEPRWFMHTSHTSPSDALEAARILGARHMIPMHYGTYDLGDEPVFNPKLELMRVSEQDLPFDIHYLDIGRIFLLKK